MSGFLAAMLLQMAVTAPPPLKAPPELQRIVVRCLAKQPVDRFQSMAEVRGADFARLVQLSLEYDPHPPFDVGTPEKAGPELVAGYQRRVARLAPDREAKFRAAAAALGFS